jgi:uncharacterized protein DUF4058
MPSPFPGMDPYLEDPFLWPDVHNTLIHWIREELAALLRPKYTVRIEERVYVSDDDDTGREIFVPDVKIRMGRTKKKALGSGKPGSTATKPLTLITLLDEEIHETYLKITERETRELIAVIEVISPSNKVSSAAGRESFLEKRREIIRSSTHWVEIDLLRKGTPLVPLSVRTRGDYCVHVSKTELRPKGWFWPIAMEHPLPIVEIPLKGKDPEAQLNLQRVLDRTYDGAGYDLDINYRKPPVVRLTPEQNRWADQLLRSKGLR